MSLTNISPIDGRYNLTELQEYFSEYALIKKRVFVELMYLKELGKGVFFNIYDDFNVTEAEKVKEIEKTTNHDVKAVEYYIKERVPEDVKEFVHYGLTSEDVNNLSYSLLIKEFMEYYFEKIKEILKKLHKFSLENKSLPMLARTHGQPASPTTLGKEFFVFYTRIGKELRKLEKIKLTGKLNGATGNYNALVFVEPEKDWLEFSKKFIIRLGLQPNLITTQIEPKDNLVELFHAVKRINNILLDLDKDIWLYISFEYFSLKKKDSEVGSSTMPHKINPIDFENSEGNLKIANSLFTGFESLQISRLQRDLSDSTIMRNIGVAFSHCIIAYNSTLKGLNKLIPNKEKIQEDLQKHPEILTEAIQMLLRKQGKAGYEELKELSRGKKITLEDIQDYVKDLEIEDYIGLAEKLVK